MTSANRSRYPGENAPWCLALMDAAYGYQFLLTFKIYNERCSQFALMSNVIWAFVVYRYYKGGFYDYGMLWTSLEYGYITF